MAVKDITDLQVCEAYDLARRTAWQWWPYEFLMQWTGQPEKVCWRAMERAERNGLIDSGVSLRTGWLTDKGTQLLAQSKDS